MYLGICRPPVPAGCGCRELHRIGGITREDLPPIAPPDVIDPAPAIKWPELCLDFGGPDVAGEINVTVATSVAPYLHRIAEPGQVIVGDGYVMVVVVATVALQCDSVGAAEGSQRVAADDKVGLMGAAHRA